MIQNDAKKLLEGIKTPFDRAHRNEIFSKIDQFSIAGDNKAKLMGAMIKAYLEREWQFERAPELTALQKFIGGEFNIRFFREGRENPACHWDDTPDFLFTEGVRNMFMLYRLTDDVLERREGYGEEGRRMAKTMAVLLFDDASFPKPEAKPRYETASGAEPTDERYIDFPKRYPDYSALEGQKHLQRFIGESGYNPFAALSVAEVGGIKHVEIERNQIAPDSPVTHYQYFTNTLSEAPLTHLFHHYRNAGGQSWLDICDDDLVNLANYERHFGAEPYDYFLTNNVIALGSGMGRVNRRGAENDQAQERKLARELIAVGHNITGGKGVSFHLITTDVTGLMREVLRSKGDNDLLHFMGATMDGNAEKIMHTSGRTIIKESMDALENGVPFTKQVGGQQSVPERSANNSQPIRPH